MSHALCACGCGQPAPIAKRTNTAKGHVKGQPCRFRQGHGAKPPDPAPRIPFIVRFEKYVTPLGPDDCWLWTGPGGEYGHVKVANRQIGAHVATYQEFVGEVPAGMVVRHTCDTPRCCNWHHLIIGTYLDNTRDALERDRIPWGEGSASARLTAEQVHEIRHLRSSGMTQVALAERFGVSRGAVCGILRGTTWARLQEAS
jgi:hypothetical protein